MIFLLSSLALLATCVFFFFSFRCGSSSGPFVDGHPIVCVCFPWLVAALFRLVRGIVRLAPGWYFRTACPNSGLNNWRMFH